MTPLSTGGGRGTALGALYDQQGRLLASLVQEVLLREL
jgi:acyl-CoA thioesterase